MFGVVKHGNRLNRGNASFCLWQICRRRVRVSAVNLDERDKMLEML